MEVSSSATPAAQVRQVAPSRGSPSVEAVCVAPDLVDKVWPHVEVLVHTSCQKSGLGDFGHIKKRVLSGEYLLWLAWDRDRDRVLAAAITSLCTINGRKLCEITSCGGEEFERFGFLIGRLEQYTRDEKCHATRIIGRRGWLRMLPKYKLRGVILEKVV